MLTQVFLSIVLIGATLTGSNDAVSTPACCTKNADCCLVQRGCCPKSGTVETTSSASDAAVGDAIARPNCCAKRAYCCSVKRSCCPGGSSRHAIA